MEQPRQPRSPKIRWKIRGLHEELRELDNEIKEFVDDAEKNVSAHPTASVIGAMVLGILIGRLLGRS